VWWPLAPLGEKVVCTHVPYAFTSESVPQRECVVPLRESFASDARCHPTRLHLPSMSLASICRSLMRYCAESGGPLCLSLDGSGPLSLDQANIDGSALPQSRSPLMAPGLPHSLGASGPLSLALSSGVLPP